MNLNIHRVGVPKVNDRNFPGERGVTADDLLALSIQKQVSHGVRIEFKERSSITNSGSRSDRSV